jgi:hypothetical protein
MTTASPLPATAYVPSGPDRYTATAVTRGPWEPGHQHAGPPTALVCRAIEAAAQTQGLTHVARLTVNLLRPVPIGELVVEVAPDYVGRNAGHYSARLVGDGKEVARFTALVQRENDVPLPDALPGHPAPGAPRRPEDSPVAVFPFAHRGVGYADLVEARTAHGRFVAGPCAAWFRLLLDGETPSAYQCVAVAADSGNGISAVLDLAQYTFVNADLTINLLRRPHGEWICLDAQTHLGPNGCGMVASRLYDVHGLVGSASQSLAVRARTPG